METYAQNQLEMSYIAILKNLSGTFSEQIIKIEAFSFFSIPFKKEQKSFPLI